VLTLNQQKHEERNLATAVKNVNSGDPVSTGEGKKKGRERDEPHIQRPEWDQPGERGRNVVEKHGIENRKRGSTGKRSQTPEKNRGENASGGTPAGQTQGKRGGGGTTKIHTIEETGKRASLTKDCKGKPLPEGVITILGFLWKKSVAAYLP